MSDQFTRFVTDPSGDTLVWTRIYWTDSVTGLVTEGWEVANITQQSVSYLDTSGVVRATGANETRSREPIRVNVGGSQQLTVTNAANVTLTAPANAAAAEVYIYDRTVVYTLDGVTTPDDSLFQGVVVPKEAVISLESREEVLNFIVRAEAADAQLWIEYFNMSTSQKVTDV